MEPQKAGKDIMWVALLFKRIQVETLKECLSYCPLIANPVNHAAKGKIKSCDLEPVYSEGVVVSFTSGDLPKDHKAADRSSTEEAKGSCKMD